MVCFVAIQVTIGIPIRIETRSCHAVTRWPIQQVKSSSLTKSNDLSSLTKSNDLSSLTKSNDSLSLTKSNDLLSLKSFMGLTRSQKGEQSSSAMGLTVLSVFDHSPHVGSFFKTSPGGKWPDRKYPPSRSAEVQNPVLASAFGRLTCLRHPKSHINRY